jgi:hypothetical protein
MEPAGTPLMRVCASVNAGAEAPQQHTTGHKGSSPTVAEPNPRF